MANSNNGGVASGGIGLFGFVFLIFLVLKLAEIGQVAAWSWWWVTAPLWGPLVFVLGLCLLMLLAYVIFVVLRGFFSLFKKD